jgi:hypothetical protein
MSVFLRIVLLLKQLIVMDCVLDIVCSMMSKENSSNRSDMVLNEDGVVLDYTFLERMLYYFTVKQLIPDSEEYEPVIEGDYQFIVKFRDSEDRNYIPSLIEELFMEYSKPCLVKIYSEGSKAEWYYMWDEREFILE